MKYFFAEVFIATAVFSSATSALPAAAITEEPLSLLEEVAQIRHNNGGLIAINGEALPFNSEYFPVMPGDTITTSRGFTDFSLLVHDAESSLWGIEIYPGDSFASFDIGDVFINVSEPFSDTLMLSSGQANVIAYGYDPQNSSPVMLTAPSGQSVAVPEPALGLGVFMTIGMAYFLRRVPTKEA